MILFLGTILIIIKYILCVVILIGIILAPAGLARINKRPKYEMLRVRMGSWLLGWTGVGWLFALFLGAKK